jgi:hypothetical protein
VHALSRLKLERLPVDERLDETGLRAVASS